MLDAVVLELIAPPPMPWLVRGERAMRSASKREGIGMAIDIDLTRFSEAELHELNRMIVERIRRLQQAAAYRELAKLSVGDRVAFDAHDGRRVEGTIIRVSKRTATIHTDDHHHWRVSPALLKVIGRAPAPTLSNVVDLRS